MLFRSKDLLFFSADIHGNLMTRERVAVLRHLMEEPGGIVVTTMDGLMDHLLPLEHIKNQTLTVSGGQTIDLNVWRRRLTALGYERMAQVDGMGQFSIRGGIIDVFPLTEETPVRIELWDDEVDSIRTFDLESQRSIEQLDSITIYPAAEAIMTPGQLAEGIEALEKEAKAYEKALRSQKKIEEASRIRGIIGELAEELKEGMKLSGLDAYVRYVYQKLVKKF